MHTHTHTRTHPHTHTLTRTRTQLAKGEATESLLCMPVLDSRHRVRGVVQAVGRRGAAAFTPADQAALAALCSHIAADLETIESTGAAQASDHSAT
jgi:GAF domain-containing protein